MSALNFFRGGLQTWEGPFLDPESVKSGCKGDTADHSMGQEALKSEINLPEDDPELVRLMIDYLYRLDYDQASGKGHSNDAVELRPETKLDSFAQAYPVRDESLPVEVATDAPVPVDSVLDEPEDGLRTQRSKKGKKKMKRSTPDGHLESSATQTTGLATHARMYSLADKYGIGGLKVLAQQKFEQAVRQQWDSEEFAPAVHVVYASTPDGDRSLRDVVMETIYSYKSLLQKLEVETAVRDIPGLAFDLLKYTWARSTGASNQDEPGVWAWQSFSR